jgi:hypothetical protein
MDKPMTLPSRPMPLGLHSAPQQFPPVPSLDRSAPPAEPQQPMPRDLSLKLDSHDAKLAVQKSLASDVIPIKFSQHFPCGVHACLNYTNCGQISYDLTFRQYRISVLCPECMKKPRP